MAADGRLQLDASSRRRLLGGIPSRCDPRQIGTEQRRTHRGATSTPWRTVRRMACGTTRALTWTCGRGAGPPRWGEPSSSRDACLSGGPAARGRHVRGTFSPLTVRHRSHELPDVRVPSVGSSVFFLVGIFLWFSRAQPTSIRQALARMGEGRAVPAHRGDHDVVDVRRVGDDSLDAAPPGPERLTRTPSVLRGAGIPASSRSVKTKPLVRKSS